MSLDSGEVDESSCRYSVPLVDCQGNMHLLKARGVGYTIYAKERKVPPTAATVFTEMEGSASRAHQAAGMVDLIVGQGYSLWHPRKVCDSWQTEDNLTLMRSEFPPRYMVRETTSTKRRVWRQTGRARGSPLQRDCGPIRGVSRLRMAIL
jgi:hypothetical protein